MWKSPYFTLLFCLVTRLRFLKLFPSSENSIDTVPARSQKHQKPHIHTQRAWIVTLDRIIHEANGDGCEEDCLINRYCLVEKCCVVTGCEFRWSLGSTTIFLTISMYDGCCLFFFSPFSTMIFVCPNIWRPRSFHSFITTDGKWNEKNAK